MVRPLKLVALFLALSLAVAQPPRAEARSKAGKFIAAAMLGAVIASAASGSRHHRNHSSYGRTYYSPTYGNYYAAPGYRAAPVYSSYYTAPAYSGYYGVAAPVYQYTSPSVIYRTNSGYGYDRYGAYTYDPCRFSQYGGYSTVYSPGYGCR